MSELSLLDLVGEHLLDAVDTLDERVKRYEWGDEEPCECVLFRLDGKVYKAIQDPSDGYRSCMDRIEVSDAPMRNVFEPQRVIAIHRAKSEWGGISADILELRDVVTGKVVLEIGTDNADDYYPSWVAAFHPEAMAINSPTGTPAPSMQSATIGRDDAETK